MGRRASRFLTACLAAGVLGVLVTCNGLVASATTGAAGAQASQRPLITSVSPIAGPVGGGSAVTIHGARFAHVSAVFIGGEKARNVRVISASVLKAVTPAHAAGSVAITVAEKAGRSPASPVRFRYLNRPVVTGLTPRSGLVTGGQVVTIAGRGLSYVRSVSFGSLRAAPLPRSTAARRHADMGPGLRDSRALRGDGKRLGHQERLRRHRGQLARTRQLRSGGASRGGSAASHRDTPD